MVETLLVVMGLVLGVVGFYIGLLRGRGAFSGEVSGLTATLGEVRGQLATREGELVAARAALEQQKIDSAQSSARLASAREHFAEQRRQIEEMEKKVKETFESVSSAALKSNNEQFLTLAETKMKPLREQLERYEKQIAELEKTRAEAYGGISKQLQRLDSGREQLSRETNQLVSALRQSGAKGKWGEVTLQRIVELSGMSPHCDFETQVTQADRRRPDLVVHLPGGRMLAVDSKVNTSGYLDAMNATEESERRRFLGVYAKEVRGTLRTLGEKAYWKQFSPAPEFVVMFMPGEAFFAAAISEDNNLIVDGVERGVLLASPTTLIALLLAVRHGWQQQVVAENAEEIAKAGRDLYDRLCTFVSHLDAVRGGIEKAAEAYDKAVGNWERRTLPGVNRLRELGAETGKEMEELRRASVPMRALPGVEEDSVDIDARRVS